MFTKSPLSFVLILLFYLVGANSSFIKGKNVPRVGRSNEADGPYNQGMGYVIKSTPAKVIPRMGRRNFDAEKLYEDNHKFYEYPIDYPQENSNDYEEVIEPYYLAQMENMK